MRVGIDLVEISRIAKSIQNPRFRTGVFSAQEQEMLEARGWNVASAAANFAAKEAFAKALGTGVRGFSLSEVSVLRDDLGAPYLLCSGRADALMQGKNASVSLTHTDTLAQAIVILY